MITNVYHLLDTLRADLSDLHPSDRLSAAARMLGRESLVADDTFREAFSTWRKGVCL
jgi:hypothetical protein